jgi:hypothetical protein
MPRPSSRQYCGSWVLLPDPVSPATISTWLRRKRLHDGFAPRRDRQIGVVLENQRLRPRARRPLPRLTRHASLLATALLRIEVQSREYQAALRAPGFHAAKAPLEFGVGGAQAPPPHRHRACVPDWRPRTTNRRPPRRSRRDGAARARGIRKFTLLRRLAHFGQLFGYLVGGLTHMLEIEAHAGRPLAELEGPHQRRQRLRHAVQVTGRQARLRCRLSPRRAPPP